MNNPDLGNLEIIEKPLLIHEAKAGGRRLTKTLFRQLPDWTETHNSLILPDCTADIVAWVNHHWKECDSRRGYYDAASGDHIHILLSENSKPYRGTVWNGPQQRNGIDINSWDGQAGEAIAAILARKKINGEEIKSGRHNYDYSFNYSINHQGRHIRFDCDTEISKDLRFDLKSDHGGNDWVSKKAQETRGRLVKVAQLQETDETLITQIDEYITAEDNYRTDVKQVWQLVTMETPQVFL
jgi:hypothetical protein